MNFWRIVEGECDMPTMSAQLHAPRIKEALDGCNTPQAIDAFFDSETGYESLEDRIRFLSEYMGVLAFHYTGGGNDELTYALMKEAFCDGDWRLICGRNV